MYDENFKLALNVFDEVLDRLATRARLEKNKNKDNCKCIGITLNPVNGNHEAFDLYEIEKDLEPTNRVADCCCGSGANRDKFINILDDIKSVIFNAPATSVTFKDGTKVCVKASKGDTFNKETGLVYAIVKRLYANDVEEKTGYLRSRGLGEKINQIVADGFDQKEQERERRAKRKAKLEAKKNKEADEAGEKAAKEAVEKVLGKENG